MLLRDEVENERKLITHPRVLFKFEAPFFRGAALCLESVCSTYGDNVAKELSHIAYMLERELLYIES